MPARISMTKKQRDVPLALPYIRVPIMYRFQPEPSPLA
jgi:hypothetical protein